VENGDQNSNKRSIRNQNCIVVQIGYLIDEAHYASSVNIKGLGWFLFGGVLSKRETSQKLENINSRWMEGPAVLGKEIFAQCVVQVRYLWLFQ